MVVSFFYEIFLWLLAIIYLPKLAYDYFVRKKYKQSLGRRLGFKFPFITKGKRKLIWIHAVSVGETKAIASLVKTIRKELNHPIIIISNVTETGHAEARRSIPLADHHVFLPIDLRCVIRPIIKRSAPDLLILSETDFWYNFIKGAKDSGAAIALVNGKISERSMNHYMKIPFFSKNLFSFFNKFCVQNKHYQKRFYSIGVDESKMEITGNLKFDDEYPRLTADQQNAWKKQLQISPEDQIVVLGSSHNPEEKLVLEQMRAVWAELPHVKLVIVPRHPERFQEVASLLDRENIPYLRFSHPEQSSKPAKVILMDAMGLLRKCYQLADIAIVAGSYTPRIGGHNILEPSWYGVPVFYGPYMHSQPELVELMEEYGAGEQVIMEDLSRKLIDFLKNKEKRTLMGANGLRMQREVNGATQKTWNVIKDLLYPKV